MNRKLIAFLGASGLSLAVVLAYATWERGALPGLRPTMHEVAFADLSLDQRGVKVAGTAHYPVGAQINARSGPRYAFPLFAPNDTAGRTIRVLVLSPTPPDPTLGFEDRTIEGLIQPPGMQVPEGLRKIFEEQGYHFAEDYMILEVM